MYAVSQQSPCTSSHPKVSRARPSSSAALSRARSLRVRLRRRASEAEQRHAGHLKAHAVVGQGKRRGDLPGQPRGKNIRLRQTGGDQAKRLAVNFAALADGVDIRHGGLHLLIHHDAARAANAAGFCQRDVGLYTRSQHHARGGDAASVEQRHGIVSDGRDAGGEPSSGSVATVRRRLTSTGPGGSSRTLAPGCAVAQHRPRTYRARDLG